MTFRNVVVALDLRDASPNVLALAARVAAPGAAFHLVHVIEPVQPHAWVSGGGAGNFSEVIGELRRQARSRLASLAKNAGLDAATVDVAVTGVARGVAEAVESYGADLVVTGARRSERVERWLLGSHARAILRASPVTVLVARRAPAPPPAPAFQHVAVATDFHDAARAAGAVAARVAHSQGARLSAVHAIDPASVLPAWSVTEGGVAASLDTSAIHSARRAHAEEQMATYRTDVLGGADGFVPDGTPLAAVASYVDLTSVDVLVVGTHGHGPVTRMLLGSVAEALSEQLPCHVLVVKGDGAD